MIKKLKEYLFPTLISFSALSVSASAAFYSVSGLSKLFAGAAVAVIIMATSLEVAKLVIASLLYQYRETLPKLLKIYLSIACIVLIAITSMGIYGFLSSAYQETANKAGIVENQIKLLETKKTSFEKIKGQYEIEKTSLTENITTLRNALGNNTQSYVDNNGNVISYSSSANRKAFEKQLEVAIQKDEQLTTKIQTFNDSIINLETQIVETQINSETTSELGPLKYLSNLTGVAMDKIINWLLLVIIFVFDPLAISLVIAANFAFEKLKNKTNMYGEEIVEEKTDKKMKWFNWFKKKDNNSYPESQVEPENLDIEHNEGTDFYTEDELSDWDETLMDGLEDLEWDEYGNPSPIIKEKSDIDSETESLLELQPEIIEYPRIEEIDVNQDGVIDDKDIIKIETILKDPNLPEYKRNYWNHILLQIKKRLISQTNTITYN